MASKEVTQIFLIKRFRPSINHLVEAETCRRTLVFDTSNAMILSFQGCFKYVFLFNHDIIYRYVWDDPGFKHVFTETIEPDCNGKREVQHTMRT